VRTSDGSPLAGARVAVGGYGELTTRATESAVDGSYRLSGIPPGTFEVVASLRDVGSAKRSLAGDDESELEWNPVIDAGRVLGGRLVDERGAPLGGWAVSVGAGGHGWDRPSTFRAAVTSASNGGFRFVGCPNEPLWLIATSASPDAPFAEVEREDLRAGVEEVVVTVLDAERATSWIVGRVVAGAAGAGTRVALERSGRTRGTDTWADTSTGEFRFGPLAPGEFALVATNDEVGATRLDGLVLAAGETRDVGALVLASRGRLHITFKLPEGVPAAAVSASLMTPDRVGVRLILGEEIDGDIELDPGRYLIETFGGAQAPAIPFTITPGERTDVTIAPQRSATLILKLDLPVAPHEPFPIEVTLRPHDGSEPLRFSETVAPHETAPLVFQNTCAFSLPFAPRYTLEVVGPDGVRGSVELTGDDLRLGPKSDRPPVRVVLR
jgi:hypothetical protein